MKAVVTADIHLSAYGSDEINKESGLPERLHSIMTTLEQMATYARENKCVIIIAGDIFHNKSIIHSIAQSLFLDYIRRNNDIFFHILDGNHDLSSKSGDGISSLKCVDNEKNVKTYHTGEKVENIMFIPWNKYIISSVKSSNADYLISHFGLSEGVLNSGISIVSDISLKDLKNYKTVILGHYHKPQFIENEKTKLYYVGSPIELDRGERGDVKRFLVIDTEKHTIENIPTVGYRKNFVLEITTENKNEVLKKAQCLQNEGHKVQLRKIDASLQLENDIKEEFNIIDKSEFDITNRGINMDMDDREKFLMYLKIKEIPKELHELYLSVAVDIIERTS